MTPMANTTAQRGPQGDGGSVILVLSGVTAGYGAELIVKGVDLSVETGKIVCLIGPNGAGSAHDRTG